MNMGLKVQVKYLGLQGYKQMVDGQLYGVKMPILNDTRFQGISWKTNAAEWSFIDKSRLPNVKVVPFPTILLEILQGTDLIFIM